MSVVLDLPLRKGVCLSKADLDNLPNPQPRAELLHLLRLTQHLDQGLDESQGEIARHARDGYACARLPMCRYLHVLDLYRYADAALKRHDGSVTLHTIYDIMVVRLRQQEYTLFLSAREDLQTGTWKTECLSVEKCNRAVRNKYEAKTMRKGGRLEVAPAALPNARNTTPTRNKYVSSQG